MQILNLILEIVNALMVIALVVITWLYARSTAQLLEQAQLQAEILIQSAKISVAAVKAEAGLKGAALSNVEEAFTALDQLLHEQSRRHPAGTQGGRSS